MSERTEDTLTSPDDSARRSTARRAIVGGALGLALLIGPVAIANALLPEDGDGGVEAASADSETSLINLRRQSSNQHDLARVSGLQAMRTTTTPAPTTTTTAPPTTTTEPPATTEPPTTSPPATDPPAPDNGGGLGDPNSYASWDALAQCESGGNWSINTGNGYYGGLQFSLSTWQGVGGTGYPHEASRETQIAMGQRLYASSGWHAWPACSAKLGFI
jgi:hypothetical protein